MQPSEKKHIHIRGARTNNLKGIDVDIPREKITALVGVSGAGKTSLAFGTLYAEGYLRYIESISPYVRQFLDKIEKPPVDRVDGLPPAIAFRHKKPAKNPRSIVATSSDIYDYLRIVFAKLSEFYCPHCGVKVEKHTIDEIVEHILKGKKKNISVCFEYKGSITFLINRGYYYHIENGEKKRIGKEAKGKPLEVLLDEIEVAEKSRSRIFEAIDRSISMGGRAAIFYQNGSRHSFPVDLTCPRCEIRYDPPDENLFSFNSPRGACPECKGFGDIQVLDRDIIFDRSLSISTGAIRPLAGPSAHAYFGYLVENAMARGIDIHKPVSQLGKKDINFLMEGDPSFPGIRGFFDSVKKKSYKVQARVFISRYTTYKTCPHCGGSRLNPISLAFKFMGLTVSDVLAKTIGEAHRFFASIDPSAYKAKISTTVFDEIRSRLDYLVSSGLSYIHLNRHTFTLSRGEFQRINLAFILGSVLSDSLLIIDQPSADLHPHDYSKLSSFLTQLKSFGNTVLIIEHNRDMIEDSDHILELGPFSGNQGGEVVFAGAKKKFFLQSKTVTQKSLRQSIRLKESRPSPSDWYRFKNADSHNLKNFSFQIPRERFSVITGVSGSGKTTLIYNEVFLKNKSSLSDMIFIDPGIQKVRTTTTVVGFFEIFSLLRDFYSRLKESQLSGFLPGHFSFNSPLGRCEECRGKGYVEMEMQFLPPVRITCNECRGLGYKPEVLRIKYKGRNIHDVLHLTVCEAQETFADDLPKVRTILKDISDNGMGYLKLGQRLSALSLGELQRLKLIKYLNMRKRNSLFLIDEPSFGLHPFDINMLKNLIDKILANHNTVVAADHNYSLIAHADYIIDLGPEGGDRGGYLLFEGKPEGLVRDPESITGGYLGKKIQPLENGTSI